MIDSTQTQVPPQTERTVSRQLSRFAFFAIAVALCFAVPLWNLLRFSMASDFFSYIPLVPFITAYLLRTDRAGLPQPGDPNLPGVVVSGAAGLALLGLVLWGHAAAPPLERSLYLCLATTSFLLILLAGAFYFFGARLLRAAAFPVAFLAFFIPPPEALLAPVSLFFQHSSAWAAGGFFEIVRTPVLIKGLEVELPGIALTVAPECSGIHSTMVLLMTALLGGYMFLRSGWRRALLAVIIVPLAILRNGFRIFVIGEMCVHIGPEMIDSPIHRHGGPLFFALSLIPFFLLLVYLRKTELSKDASASTVAQGSTIV